MRQRSLIVSSISLVVLSMSAAASDPSGFIGSLQRINTINSTVPANGDQNPYGVAVVPNTIGKLIAGHILVSNFNNNGPDGGEQGTGTTIVEISPTTGDVDLFARINAATLPGPCPGGVGLTTALVVLQSGWVIVGSLPTKDGTAATAQAGCLIVLNPFGHVVETLSGGSINGPWDMTAFDFGSRALLFVTNVLNGTVAAGGSVVNDGTVVRIFLSTLGPVPNELSRTVIASGFGERTDPAALVIGPTGVALGSAGLYVADTLGNQIVLISDPLTRTTSAGTGTVVSSGGSINSPLGLVLDPLGNLLVANGGDGNLVEVTPGGAQIQVKTIDTTGIGAGTLFGLAVAPLARAVYFVNDGNNTLDVLH